jgi:hypothetical protein
MALEPTEMDIPQNGPSLALLKKAKLLILLEV